MLLFPPPLEISPEEGFTHEKDIFDRKRLGEGLVNLVTNITDPLVVAVDGQWGSGKTTFLKMWAGLLRQRGFPVIYFDAFEHDYLDDAFGAIAGEIIALIEDEKKARTSIASKFLKNALAVTKVAIKIGVKVGAKVATVGALDGTEFSSAAKDLADEIGSVSENALETIVKSRKQKSVVQSFKDALSELPKLLAAQPKTSSDHKSLVFIIDELDRCRPSIALEVLERIKHFFSVPGVHFVLGVHFQQLQESIKLAYGANVNAKKYLQKFINLMFFLYDKADSERERTGNKYVNYLASAMKFDTSVAEIDTSLGIIRDIAVEKDLSLREIEQIMTTYAIALAFTPQEVFKVSPLLAGLAILKVIEPDLFRKAKRGTLTYREVKDVLVLDTKGGDSQLNKRREWFAKWWQLGTEGGGDQQFINDIMSQISRYGIHSPTRMVPFMANEVIDRYLSGSEK